MIPDGLDEMFDCTEPRGRARLTHRTCLKRQTDTRYTHATKQERPANPYCAEVCPTGRAVRARFPGVDVKSAPRQAISFGTYSPAGKRQADALAKARPAAASNEVGKQATAPERAPEPQQPAPPAEEKPMPCPECKSPTRHKSDCPRASGAKVAKPKKKLALAKPRSLEDVARRKADAPAEPVAAAEGVAPEARERADLAAFSVAELVRMRANALEESRAITEELRRRAEQIADALKEAA